MARIPADCPLLLFLLLTFLGPIGAMLTRGVVDTEIARILPNVARALRRWDGRDSAGRDDVRRADRRHSRGARGGHAGTAATRLNYDISGFRSLLFATGRRSARPS